MKMAFPPGIRRELRAKTVSKLLLEGGSVVKALTTLVSIQYHFLASQVRRCVRLSNILCCAICICLAETKETVNEFLCKCTYLARKGQVMGLVRPESSLAVPLSASNCPRLSFLSYQSFCQNWRSRVVICVAAVILHFFKVVLISILWCSLN